MKFYDLSGAWELCLDPEKKGRTGERFDVSFRETMELPGTVSEAKKSPFREERNTGYLTDPYAYEDYAWFAKDVALPDYDAGVHYTLTLERTRKSAVWVDDAFVGSCDSLCTAHEFDLTAWAKPSFRLTILVDNTDYPTRGGHMTSPDTQTNWIGILGRMGIAAEAPGRVRQLRVTPNVETMELSVSLELLDEPCTAVLSACGTDRTAKLVPGENRVSLPVPEAELWSEWHPTTYELAVTTERGNGYRLSFGMRDFHAVRRGDGTYGFCINGRDTLLRGKHDGMIFPMTGYAPMDEAGWLRVMETAKAYGINHYRFHTCCPPDAAFAAADRLGIYMEPELPFWGTIHALDDPECSAAEQAYLIHEGYRILREFGHHPSFVMMSLGNELWGSPERLGEILAGFRAYEPRILYTSGSNNFQFCPAEIPEEDFFVGVRLDRDALIRGSYAMCDAPQGFVQTEEPASLHDYDQFFAGADESGAGGGDGEIEIQYGTGVKKVKAASVSGRYQPQKPVVSHEVGQYCTYPDLSEIERYTGVLKARNFEVFRERLHEAGLLELAADFTAASGALAAACYKLEIEAARRSRNLAGYQLLDLQDFTGQGTATVGILNSFMEPKGIVSREAWNAFNGETVVLAGVSRFVVRAGEELSVKLYVSHYGEESLRDAAVSVEMGEFSCELPCPELKAGLTELGTVRIPTRAGEQKTETLSLRLSVSGGEKKASNSYEFYLYPSESEYASLARELTENGSARVSGEASSADGRRRELLLTTSPEEAEAALARNENVLLVTNRLPGIESTYCTDFWCYPMFRSISESMNKPVPVGTLGLLIDNGHPALSGFPCETYTTPRWYRLIEAGKCVVLDGTGIRPIVRTIDNFERNHSLGLLFEARKGGKLLVCAIDPAVFTEYPECGAFWDSICRYALSDGFLEG